MLITLSIVIYIIKYLVFGSLTDTANCIFNSLGYLPISALLVTIILNRLLTVRQKRERLEKMNMVIGTFYSEIGNYTLSFFSRNKRNSDGIRHFFSPSNNWENTDFSETI